MNYYAKGGQAHGLKALAQELPKYGRHGDSIVAHISPQEAGILKALGGSGTINPTTGLPEYFRNPFKSVQRAIGQLNPLNPGSAAGKAVGSIPGVKEAQNLGTQVFQPLEKAVVQPASRGLASFDKMVGNTIPGGWGTIAQTVAAMTPGMQPLAIGLGAANGSGVMRKGGSFNLKGAMIGGATAYATSELGEYLRAAGGAPDAALLPVSDPALLTSADTTALNALSSSMEAGAGAGLQVAPPPGIMSNLASGNFSEAMNQVGARAGEAFTNAGDSIYNAGKSVVNAPGNAIDAVKNYDYSGAVDNATKGMSDTGTGIKNLITGNANPAAAAAVKAGTTMAPMTALAGTAYGTMNLMDQEAQLDYLKQQKAAGNIADAEYNAAVAEINRQRDYAADVVSKSPFSTNPSRDTSIGETFYGRGGAEDTLYGRGNSGTTLYAQGGDVQGYFGGGIMQMIGDKAQMIKDAEAKKFVADNPINISVDTSVPQGASIYLREQPDNINGESNFYGKRPELETLYDKFRRNEYAMGGSVDDENGMDEARGLGLGNLSNGFMNMGSTPAFAAGGQARFLSGGGDGMSDDIPATINGNQEARLADGEFVIPADVVSHLGNGSSKAGAKQLYSMMDKVRTARTGRKAQGKQINPRKYLAA